MKHSIIPLFIPHYGCPHQCIFCNQIRITGASTPVTAEEVARTIDRYLAGAGEGRYWEAAFYGGSFTALPPAVMEALLAPAKAAKDAGRIEGIRLSTRPDCIDEAVLRLLRRCGVDTVELGVQSLDEAVLARAERGHTGSDAAEASALLRQAGFQVGLQFMVGLPGEDWRSLRRTARLGAALRPDFIRLYPVLVLRDTTLFALYQAGQYRPLSVREAAFRCAFLKRWYGGHGIPVIRTGLQATEELDRGDSLAAGPYHPAMGELADQVITRHALCRGLSRLAEKGEVTIRCHPRDRSRIAGHRKETWRLLQIRCAALTCEESKQVRPGTALLIGGGRTAAIVFQTLQKGTSVQDPGH